MYRTEETLQYFVQYYSWYRGKHIEQHAFFRRPYSLVWHQEKILEKVFESNDLSGQNYSLMKEYATKFIPRIRKCFGQQLALSHIDKTPIQDAEHLIVSSQKLTYRWAAGIIVSNHIAALLIRLSNFKRGEKIVDDINTLYANSEKQDPGRKTKAVPR